MLIATSDEHGNPQCPICYSEVDREGEFDSPECWQRFHVVVFEMAEVVEMNYLDIEEQPWYGETHQTLGTLQKEEDGWVLHQDSE